MATDTPGADRATRDAVMIGCMCHEGPEDSTMHGGFRQCPVCELVGSHKRLTARLERLLSEREEVWQAMREAADGIHPNAGLDFIAEIRAALRTPSAPSEEQIEAAAKEIATVVQSEGRMTYIKTALRRHFGAPPDGRGK